MKDAPKTPLRLLLDALPDDERHGAQHKICEGFHSRGWPCSDVAVSLWASGQRIPNFENQVRLEIVTDRKISTGDWERYRRSLRSIRVLTAPVRRAAGGSR